MDEGLAKNSLDDSLAKKVRAMDDLQLNSFIQELAATAGAAGGRAALAGVGLGDEGAVDDIKAIRGIMSGYRIVKTNAKMTAMKGFGKMLGWGTLIVTLAIVGHFFPEATRKIAERIAEP